LTSSVPSRLSNRTVSARYVLFTTSIMSAFVSSPISRESRGRGISPCGDRAKHVCIVPGLRVRSNAGIRSSSVVLRKYCCASYFASLFIWTEWRSIRQRAHPGLAARSSSPVSRLPLSLCLWTCAGSLHRPHPRADSRLSSALCACTTA
jgi:hypothetical protein